MDNAEGIISIDTYADHKAELDGLAYELGVMAADDAPAVETPAQETADIDKPFSPMQRSLTKFSVMKTLMFRFGKCPKHRVNSSLFSVIPNR